MRERKADIARIRARVRLAQVQVDLLQVRAAVVAGDALGLDSRGTMVVILSVMSSQESWMGPSTSIQRAKNCVPGTVSTSPRRRSTRGRSRRKAGLWPWQLVDEIVKDVAGRGGDAFVRARDLEAIDEERAQLVGVGGRGQQLRR